MALLQVALVLLAAQSAAAQRLYQRPASFESDCLPSTTTATTFSSIFPSDFFLSGDKTSTNGGTTTVRLCGPIAGDACCVWLTRLIAKMPDRQGIVYLLAFARVPVMHLLCRRSQTRPAGIAYMLAPHAWHACGAQCLPALAKPSVLSARRLWSLLQHNNALDALRLPRATLSWG